MLDSFYQMTLKVLYNHVFGTKTPRFCHIYTKLLWVSIHSVTKSVAVFQFLCMALYHFRTQRHMVSVV